MSNRVGSEKKWGNISIYQGTGLLYALPQKTVTLFIGTIKSEVWLLSITNKLDLSLSIFTQYHHAFFHHRERRVFNYFFHCYAWLHLAVMEMPCVGANRYNTSIFPKLVFTATLRARVIGFIPCFVISIFGHPKVFCSHIYSSSPCVFTVNIFHGLSIWKL